MLTVRLKTVSIDEMVERPYSLTSSLDSPRHVRGFFCLRFRAILISVQSVPSTTVHGPYAASRNPKFGAVDAIGPVGGVEAT